MKQRFSYDTTEIIFVSKSFLWNDSCFPHKESPSPPPPKKGKKIVVCPLIKTKNASVGPLFGNSCKPLPLPPMGKATSHLGGAAICVTMSSSCTYSKSGITRISIYSPPPSPVGRVTSHLGGAAICVIMSSSCTSSKSGMTGISEEKKSNFV